METWKYGYQLEYPFTWLFAQTRKTELNRGKIMQLKNAWLGRDGSGKINPGSGTADLNSAQYTPAGASAIYTEGWTPARVMAQAAIECPEQKWLNRCAPSKGKPWTDRFIEKKILLDILSLAVNERTERANIKSANLFWDGTFYISPAAYKADFLYGNVADAFF